MIDPAILRTAIAVKAATKSFAESYSKGMTVVETEKWLYNISKRIKAMRKLNKKNVQSLDSQQQDSSGDTVQDQRSG